MDVSSIKELEAKMLSDQDQSARPSFASVLELHRGFSKSRSQAMMAEYKTSGHKVELIICDAIAAENKLTAKEAKRKKKALAKMSRNARVLYKASNSNY